MSKMKTYFKKKKKVGKLPEETKRQIAHELAQTFSYGDLKFAETHKKETTIKSEVFGYLETHYPDNYQQLIDEDVIEIACWYAKKEFKPSLIKIIKDIDLTKLKKTQVEFTKDMVFENYPDLPFKKAIFYAEETLEKALKWITNYETTLEGWFTYVTLASPNLALLGWVDWNKPSFLVLHTPGKNTALFQAKIESKDLVDEEKKLLQKAIHQYASYTNTLRAKVDEVERRATQWEEHYSHMKDQREVERDYNILDEVNREERRRTKTTPRINWKYIGYFLIAIIVVLIILLIVFGFSAPSSSSPPVETASIMYNSLSLLKGVS